MRTTRRRNAHASRIALILATALAALSTTPTTAPRLSAAGQEKQGKPEKEVKNPVAGDPQAIKQGQALFLLSCAYCHGVDARGGGRGPDLAAGRWLHGESDAEVFRNVHRGIPGTDMPSCGCEDDEAWRLVAFLRSLSDKAAAPVAGDRTAGEKIFFGSGACSLCHVVDGRGGRFGPDLSRIGAARSVRNLTDSIRDPDKDIPPGYESVVALTTEGKRISGVRKNEDTFSVQLMDHGERFHLFLKKDLRDVIHETKSLMPKYDERALGAKELQDLLAYLDSLRGAGKKQPR